MNIDVDPTTTLTSGIRNGSYYLESVVFRVDGQLFKVPQYRFQSGSELFRTLFSLPQGESHEVTGIEEDDIPMMTEGSCDEFPIDLPGVSACDFQRFLGVLYPLEASMDTIQNKTLDEWKSVLKTATMWSFREVRRFAIEKMTPFVSASPQATSGTLASSAFPTFPSLSLNPYITGSAGSSANNNANATSNASASTPNPKTLPLTEKVLLARECLVPSWLVEAYDEFVRRPDAISDDEAHVLGSIATARLFREREFCKDSKHYAGRAATAVTTTPTVPSLASLTMGGVPATQVIGGATVGGGGPGPIPQANNNHNNTNANANGMAYMSYGLLGPNLAYNAQAQAMPQFHLLPPHLYGLPSIGSASYGGNQNVCSHLERLRSTFKKELDDMAQED